jgi:hypothetical protein
MIIMCEVLIRWLHEVRISFSLDFPLMLKDLHAMAYTSFMRMVRILHRLLRRKGVTIYKIEWFVNMVKIDAYKIPSRQSMQR